MLPSNYYTCPFCMNPIIAQNRLLHEARCENKRLKGQEENRHEIAEERNQMRDLPQMRTQEPRNMFNPVNPVHPSMPRPGESIRLNAPSSATSNCPHCEISLPAQSLNIHFESCPMLVSTCPICKEDFPIEIFQIHLDSDHPLQAPVLQPPPSSNFFDKLANLFKSDKKDTAALLKCPKCENKIERNTYQSHLQKCKPKRINRPNRDNRLFSLDSGENRNNSNIEQDAENEIRKMRELLHLMRILMASNPEMNGQKNLSEHEIEENTFIVKFDKSKAENFNEENRKCAICQCDFENEEEVRILVCLHRFHKECADAWLKKKDWCPLCRNNCAGNEAG